MEKGAYCRSILRSYHLKDVQAWNEGESTELKKWFGFGLFNHLFISEKRMVRLYYNYEEGEEFWNLLENNLTEELFNQLCDHLFDLIEQSKLTDSKDKLFKIAVQCWPVWAVFAELSNYPELATELMMRRLLRVRRSTESFSYELSKRMEDKSLPENYILFKGRLLFKPTEDFFKENNLILKDE